MCLALEQQRALSFCLALAACGEDGELVLELGDVVVLHQRLELGDFLHQIQLSLTRYLLCSCSL